MKTVGIWLVIGLVVLTVVKQFDSRQSTKDSVSYSEFMDSAKSGKVESASVEGRTIKWVSTDKKRYITYSPGDIWMVGDLVKYGVKVEAKPEEEQSFLAQIFISWFPMLLLIGVWIFFMRQMQGGGRGGAFSFGKSKARMLDESNNTVTFADVAGCDEAKEEVAELVEFLRDPSKFQKLGGRIPRGVLMVGSPGTGKTLLAKAIAGEAKVPFFSISGSDFVEMFVGVGAARVRDMFEQAKKNAPCIVFIDEIDAVGRQRGAGLGGGNDEREQTLNQLLVDMEDFELAKDKIMMGAERKSMVMSDEEKRNTAYHESGHTVVAKLLPKSDPVHKVTIIPRGRALGVTMQLPEQDRYSYDRDYLLQRIAVLFGGRIAEEIFMHQMTTGAGNDFERATAMARDMVTRYGMSDTMGPIVYAEHEGEVFLGRSITTQKNVSEATMQKVDLEIRRIIDEQYALARKLIEDNNDKVEAMAKSLLELETLDSDQIEDIMQGRPPRPPKPATTPATPTFGPNAGPDAAPAAKPA